MDLMAALPLDLPGDADMEVIGERSDGAGACFDGGKDRGEGFMDGVLRQVVVGGASVGDV